MLKAGIDGIPHTSRPVNNNLYSFEKSDNAHFCGRSGSESDMISKAEPINQAEDHFPFVDSCLPHVKAFSYVWFHLQAAKRQYFKKCERKMPLEEELKLKNKLQSELQETKQRWATRLLAKLRKDIDSADREKLAHCLAESARHGNSGSQTEGRPLPCVLSIADLKGKMRRIDCLRQADKVWRLDIVLAVLFRAVPLESTDGERVEKSLSCRQPLLCVNPYHLNVGVRELDMFLSNYLFNFEIPVSFLNAPKANQAQFVAVTDGVYSRCVFGARELLELSQMPINSEGRPFPGNSAPAASSGNMTGSGKQQQQQQAQAGKSAFKPLMPGSVPTGSSGGGGGGGRLANANDLDHIDCDKDDGASDEEVASLSLGPPSGQYNVAGSQNSMRVGPVRQQPGPQQQQVQPSSTNRHQQPQQYPSSSSYNTSTNSTTTNRVVVLPSHGLPAGAGSAAAQFQPIRSSPPISTTSVASFIKTEIPDEQTNHSKDNNIMWRQGMRGSGGTNNNSHNAYGGGGSGGHSLANTSKIHPVEVGSDRLEDFANYVVEAASRSNSPVRKQPRLSLDAMVANSTDFDLGGSNQQSGAVGGTPFQSQPLLSGINSPSLMMPIGLLPMINGMQAAAAASSSNGNGSNAPIPPPPTHPLLYSPNPFSLFSSPAITPRTTPRSTPVPNAQSTIAAAVAAAAAQFGADNSDISGDRDRQLQLAAGLFEQNLRVFGLLGAVSGSATPSGGGLFRNPGFTGLGGFTSGFGSALVSACDTGAAGQATPSTQRSPSREMMVPNPIVNTSVPNASSSSSSSDDLTPQQRPSGTFEALWPGANSGVETPQIGSGGSGNGQPTLSTSSSSSGDDAFDGQPATRQDNSAKAGRCKPSLLLQSANIGEKV